MCRSNNPTEEEEEKKNVILFSSKIKQTSIRSLFGTWRAVACNFFRRIWNITAGIFFASAALTPQLLLSLFSCCVYLFLYYLRVFLSNLVPSRMSINGPVQLALLAQQSLTILLSWPLWLSLGVPPFPPSSRSAKSNEIFFVFFVLASITIWL